MIQTLELPDELFTKLASRLQSTGQDRTAYLIALIERDLLAPTLSDILEPFRKQVTESGISNQDLEQMFEDGRVEAYKRHN